MKIISVALVFMLSFAAQAEETFFLHVMLKERQSGEFSEAELAVLESELVQLAQQSKALTRIETFVDDSKNPLVARSFGLANWMRRYPWINFAHLLAGYWTYIDLTPYESSKQSALNAVLRLEAKARDAQDIRSSLEPQYKEWADFRQKWVQKYFLSMSFSQEYTFKDSSQVADTDYFLSFLVPWKRGMDPEESQKYWREHHGPLAARLIPEQIKRYVQDQTLLVQPLDVFDLNYQGICFENVDSPDQVKKFASKFKAWKASVVLAADEEVFSDHPSMMTFRRVTAKNL